MKIFRIILMLCFFSQPVCAEYYRYVNDAGVVCFTDNLADVPVAQRTEENRYKTIKTIKTDQSNSPLLLEKKSEKKDNSKESEALSMFQQLNKEKKVLDENYEQLVIKKQNLKKEKKVFSNSQEANAYREKVKKLNQEISDFENRRQTFEKKVKAFNEQADR